MLGTRELFFKAGEMHLSTNPEVKDTEGGRFLTRLYQQAKQISQIIAYIWRWADENDKTYAKKKEVANQLKAYFEHPTSNIDRQGERLKQLFKADPRNDSDTSIEAKLLKAVFFKDGKDNSQYIFPIFDIFELGKEDNNLGYLFEVNVNAFNGTLEDVDRNTPSLFRFVIPYPPRPALGNATVDNGTLEGWINNRDERTYFSDNPYIPTTCS